MTNWSFGCSLVGTLVVAWPPPSFRCSRSAIHSDRGNIPDILGILDVLDNLDVLYILDILDILNIPDILDILHFLDIQIFWFGELFTIFQ